MGKKQPHWYSASDYAGLHAGRFSFYYGYEETTGGEWCFVAKRAGEEIFRATATELGVDPGCPTEWGLLEGIALYIESKTKVSSDE